MALINVLTILFLVAAIIVFLIAVFIFFRIYNKTGKKSPKNPDLILNGMAKYTGGYMLLSKYEEGNGKDNRKIFIGKPADIDTERSPFEKSKEIKIPVPEENIIRYSSGQGSGIRNIIVIHPPTYAELPELFKKFPNYELVLAKKLTEIFSPLFRLIRRIKIENNMQMNNLKEKAEILQNNIKDIGNTMIEGNVFFNNQKEIEKSRGEVAIRTAGEEWAKSEIYSQISISGIKQALLNPYKIFNSEAEEIMNKNKKNKKEEI